MVGVPGGAAAQIDLRAMMGRRATIKGTVLRARPVEEKAEIVAGFLARFGAALESGEIHPVVHLSFSLADAAAAHRLVKASEHFGKVVLRVS